MSGLTDIDPDGLLEYSVVFTDRSLNHMSRRFQDIMVDISTTLRRVYRGRSVAFVPGGGTYGMESVARQFATGRKCLVLRNGWFSYRWSQILEMGAIAADTTVLKARPVEAGEKPAYTPAPVEEVVKTILDERPDIVFAPHVETASGMILPDDYMQAAADAVHEVDGLFVLDCIASGAIWVDMEAAGVDILISAPQKGWSASPCGAFVLLSQRAREAIEGTTSTTFAADLKRWLQIMEAYEGGGHAYHATMPTDSLVRFHEAMRETEDFGFEHACSDQRRLGAKVREVLAGRGFRSLAAAGFEAPGVVVSYTDDSGIHDTSKFIASGLQIAAGVPLMCDEPDSFMTFRLGLFGLDKIGNVDRTVASFASALDEVIGSGNVR